jgi:hypothetical protein
VNYLEICDNASIIPGNRDVRPVQYDVDFPARAIFMLAQGNFCLLCVIHTYKKFQEEMIYVSEQRATIEELVG